MPPLVAALDADVGVPILSCDFLLAAFDLGLYEPVVSNQVLVEVDRNLRADFPQLDPVRLSRRVGQMRIALEDHIVEARSLGGVPDIINRNDRHVIAAALACDASILVTNDKRLCSETEAADLGLWATSADELELATLGWVHWFNHDRLHSHCGHVPPAEFEAAHYAAQQATPTRVGNQ